MFFDSRQSPKEIKHDKRIAKKLATLERKAKHKQQKREYRKSLGNW